MLTVRLGIWQMDRAEQKIALQRKIDERSAMPALLPHEVPMSEYAVQDLHHRPVVLKGTWVSDATVYLDNRQMNGQPGFFVLTPLMLSEPSGPPRAVLIQRGWVPRHAMDRTMLPTVLTATGVVEVRGRIAPSPARLFEFEELASGPIRQNLAIASFAAETALPLLPFSVIQTLPDGSTQDVLLRQWARPAVGVEKHHGYAFQWFSLAALLVGLYLWFQVLRPLIRARHNGVSRPPDEI
jgi:surfeit locus 1 family protein